MLQNCKVSVPNHSLNSLFARELILMHVLDEISSEWAVSKRNSPEHVYCCLVSPTAYVFLSRDSLVQIIGTHSLGKT